MDSCSFADEHEEEESTPLTAFTSFKLFPQLPLEIRNTIWRLGFPTPRILRNIWMGTFGFWIEPPSSPRIHPVTLFVNRESRAETLRRYRDLYKYVDGWKNPVYFSPMDDAVHLDTIICFTKAGEWVRFSSTESIIQLNDRPSYIQVLILSAIFLPAHFRYAVGENGGGGMLETELEGGILARFHNLKKLFLCFNSCKHEIRGELPRFERCRELVRTYFEAEKQKWPDCKIPEIVIKQNSEVVDWPEESVS